MKRIRWHRRATAELRAAAAWYKREAEGVDERFLAQVEHAVNLLRDFPAMGTIVHRDYRRVLVNGFPYSVLYREHETFVRVVAVVHHKLDPQGWIGR